MSLSKFAVSSFGTLSHTVPSPSNALKDAIPNSVLHTIYVLEKEILQFLDLKSVAYNRERFQMASLWYIP